MKIIAFVLCFMTYNVNAQDLVYRPLNPAFGGNPYNYQWLKSSADAQNDFKEENDLFKKRSAVGDFKEQLNRQLLNSVSRELFKDTFGEDGLQPGTYTFGSLNVDISPSTEGLLIKIVDSSTGESSVVVVPYT